MSTLIKSILSYILLLYLIVQYLYEVQIIVIEVCPNS